MVAWAGRPGSGGGPLVAVAEAAVASVAAPAAVLAVRLVVGERVWRGLLRFETEVVEIGRMGEKVLFHIAVQIISLFVPQHLYRVAG